MLRVEPTPDALETLPALDPRVIGNTVHAVLEQIGQRAGAPRRAALDRVVSDRPVDTAWPDEAELRAILASVTAEIARAEGITLPGFARALAEVAQPYLEAVRARDWERNGAAVPLLGVEVEGSCRSSTDARPVAVPRGSRRPPGRNRSTDRLQGGPALLGSQDGVETHRTLPGRGSRGTATPARRVRAGFGREPGRGRFVFAKPGGEEEMAVAAVSSDQSEFREAFDAATGAALRAWDLGSFFPRVMDADGREEPRSCAYCSVAEACNRHDSGMLARLVDWALPRAEDDSRSAGDCDAERALSAAWALGRRTERRVTAVSSGAAIEAARAEDASARRAAQQLFDRPLLLEAGAGTGKTATLVARAIAWCMGPGWERHSEAGEPDAIAARVLARVVAITFTEAAAAEMAERVAGALASIERGALPPGVDAALLERYPDRPRRARALIGALDRLTVQTIHAWCRRLLAEFPVEAGLHPGFDVDADGALRERVVREVLESRLGSAYTGEGDRAFLELAAEGIGPPEIESALRTLAEEAVPAGAFDAEPLSAERIRDAVDDGIALLATWTEAEGGRIAALSRARRSAETARRLARAFDTMRAADDVSPDGIAELCNQIGEIYDSRTDERLRAWAGDRLTSAEHQALGTLHSSFVEHSRALRSWLRHFTSLRPRLLALARRVVGPLHAEVERQMRARGGVSFNHLLSEARTLVLEHASVARRIRRAIDQLLVDEFQDTDRAQCDLVARVALDGEREERPGLFVVGDPKQSIYGWRSADLAAYDGFVDRLLAEGGEVHSLSVNFRSVPAVLDEVDRVMHNAMSERRGVQPRFVPLVACEGRETDPGFGGGAFAPVEHWVTWRSSPDGGLDPQTRMREAARTEAQALARDLRALHDARGVEWGAIAILFRSRADLDTYLGALRHAGIPYAVEGDRGFYQRREIIEAAALVRCVLDPNDQLSLITWLRSATVGVPDCAWIPLWDRELPALVARVREPDDDGIETVREVIAGVADPARRRSGPRADRRMGAEPGLCAARAGPRSAPRSARTPATCSSRRLRALTLIEATEAARYQVPTGWPTSIASFGS